MHRSLQLRSPRVLNTQLLPQFLIDRIDALDSRIDVEWLTMDETIVLESSNEDEDVAELADFSARKAAWSW
jgi:hypothetical protein